AIEALQTIRKQGKKVPEDIALVGFGDSLKAAMMTPPITTVTQAKEELGQKAAEILLETLEQGKNTKLKQFLIRPELIVRESSFNMKSGQRNTVKNVEK
ncbi:MAG: substrate-binding domain-containing protein, partial [Victivallaceae bacterium]